MSLLLMSVLCPTIIFFKVQTNMWKCRSVQTLYLKKNGHEGCHGIASLFLIYEFEYPFCICPLFSQAKQRYLMYYGKTKLTPLLTNILAQSLYLFYSLKICRRFFFQAYFFQYSDTGDFSIEILLKIYYIVVSALRHGKSMYCCETTTICNYFCCSVFCMYK